MSAPENRIVVLNLFRGATPERADEIAEHWDSYNPQVEVTPPTSGVTMNANQHRIQFDAKVLDAFWLIGFSAWRSIETYSPSIVLAMIAQIPLDEALLADEELGQFERDYKDRMIAAQQIIATDQPGLVQWPPDIPKRQPDRELLDSSQDKVAFDLTCLAVAFTFLHEFRHVMFLRDGNYPLERAEEETACDVWARSFLTEKLDGYAKDHDHSYRDVLTKRSMGMALGALIVHSITPAFAHWGTAEYPPIADRVNALIGGTSLPENSHFWLFSACILVGVMRQSHRQIDIVPSNAKTLVEQIIERLK